MTQDGTLTLDWSAIAGSGFVLALLFLALVERLRRTFATKVDLNGLGSKFNALHSLYLQVRESADEARDRANAAQREQQLQAERITEQVIRPLERITEKLEAVGVVQAAQATALEHILQRLDRLEDCMSKPGTRTRRSAP